MQNALGEVTIRVAPVASGGGPGRRQVTGLKRVKSAVVAPTSGADAAANGTTAEWIDSADAEPHAGRVQYVGTAADKDIVVAAAHAHVAALNRMLAADETQRSVRGAGEGGGV